MKIYRISQNNVLFHGSDSEQFEGDIRINERDSGWFGSGFYLTAYPEYAKRWGKYTYQVAYPTAKMAEVNVQGNYDKITFVGEAENANQQAGGNNAWITNESLWSQNFVKALQSMGYGGIRTNMNGHLDVEVVIFDPSAIQILGRIN